jgi:hypothetical protein
MKKLLIILFCFISCSAVDEEIVITANYTTTIVGVEHSYRSGLTDFVGTGGWVDIVGVQGSALQFQKDPATALVKAKNDLVPLYFTCKRIGLMFDVSSIPNNMIIDSVQLQLYNINGPSAVGVAIYANPYYWENNGLLQESKDPYYNARRFSAYPEIPLITYRSSTIGGYNTYNLGTSLPYCYYYPGYRYVGYGICEYQHDALKVTPTGDNELEFNTNAASNNPKLIVYYHDTPTTSPKKIKIISIL